MCLYCQASILRKWASGISSGLNTAVCYWATTARAESSQEVKLFDAVQLLQLLLLSDCRHGWSPNRENHRSCHAQTSDFRTQLTDPLAECRKNNLSSAAPLPPCPMLAVYFEKPLKALHACSQIASKDCGPRGVGGDVGVLLLQGKDRNPRNCPLSTRKAMELPACG